MGLISAIKSLIIQKNKTSDSDKSEENNNDSLANYLSMLKANLEKNDSNKKNDSV